jgi:hypothetical protein
VKHAAAFSLWVVILWWLWQLLVGEWSHYEWIFGLGAALVAAAIAELARVRGGISAPLPWRIVKATPAALGMVVWDFATVMLVLARRGSGSFRTTEFKQPNDVPHRAWGTIVADYSPNAYIVDIDPDTGRVLTHHLVPRQISQDPA